MSEITEAEVADLIGAFGGESTLEDVLALVRLRERKLVAGPPGKSVPDARIHVQGEYFGGQYSEPTEYELTIQDRGDSVVTFEVVNRNGQVVAAYHMLKEEASEFLEFVETRDDSTRIPGLTRTITWNISDGRNSVSLPRYVLEEVAAWLEYWLLGSWEYEALGDEWQF